MLAINPITITKIDAANRPAVWLAGTTYAADALVRDSGTTGMVYKSKLAGNTGFNPVLSPVQWLLVGPATNLYSTTAPDETAWLVGTTYALDAVVSAGNYAYTSLVAGNVGNVPESTPLKWLQTGPCNSMAMFDTSPATVTNGPVNGNLVVGITPGRRISALGLLLVRGTTLRVQVYEYVGAATPIEGGDITQVMTTSLGTYYTWCFEPLLQQPDARFFDLPSTAAPYIVLTITPLAGLAQCGLCVLGRQTEIGAATYGFNQATELRGKSYIDSAGNPVRIDRGYRKVIKGSINVTRDKYNRTQTFLQENIGIPMIWILDKNLDDYRSAVMFGAYERSDMAIDNYSYSTLSLDINGYY